MRNGDENKKKTVGDHSKEDWQQWSTGLTLTNLNLLHSEPMEDFFTMGKINYNELQEMLKGGQKQADCARHFQVSEPAICKAVKRLKAAEIPASMEKLTNKERAFVLNLAEGKNKTESALAAYDCTSRDVAKTLGCRMAKEPDVKQALSDIMAQEAIPRRRRIQRLRDLIESKDLSAVSKGLDMSWKLEGAYAPEKIDVNVQMAATMALIAEIRRQEKEKKGLQNLTVLENPDL